MIQKSKKLYPASKVEINGFLAKHYDPLISLATFGKYYKIIEKSADLMKINIDDKIADFGSGTGRTACIFRKHFSKNGQLIGFDIGDDMISQFKKNCSNYKNINVEKMRIDKPMSYDFFFDKVFMSFVLHGFPQEAREQIIENAFNLLGPGGELFILDYNEFNYENSPLYVKIPFKLIECSYAYDFIKRDWKKILKKHGFRDFQEYFFFKGYVRLLRALKGV